MLGRQCMRKGVIVFLTLLALGWLCPPVVAHGRDSAKDPYDGPWEKFSLDLGAFLPSISSDIRLGVKGVGLNISLEDLLDMDVTTSVFRLDGSWRFSENLRHRLDFSWYAFRRDGNTAIGQNITIDDKVIPAGSRVESHFNLDIYRLSYSYSFFQDKRMDLAVLLGCYIMPIEFGLVSSGLANVKVDESVTAPLPVVGFRGDFAITPKWFLRTGTQVFYLEIEQFKGTIFTGKAACEYKAWKHVGIGIGMDMFNLKIEAEGEDYPGIDLFGQIQFRYIGAQLYAKVFF